MRKIIVVLLAVFLSDRYSAQDCIQYVFHFQSDVANGGPSAVYYNITAANLTIGSGSATFDVNQTEQWDTLCMTAACNLSLTIDPSTFPIGNSFSFEILLEGQALQMLTYDDSNGYYSGTFCSTITCPTQIQSQTLECDSRDFYVSNYTGTVSWEFGDLSVDPTGSYQQHNYASNGDYVVQAFVNAPGCGPEYVLNLDVNINCDSTVNCPTELLLEPLSCHDYFLHFNIPVPGLVEWQIDGVPVNNGFSEFYVNWENGTHEVIATYVPTGVEGCPNNSPITFWDTTTVACIDCQEVYMGISSVLDLSGPESLNITLSNLDNSFFIQDYLTFTPTDPVADLSYCLADGCYELHICSPTPMADSNLVVDVIDPLQIFSSTNFSVESCYGRDVVISLNSDCTPVSCLGEWMKISTQASYLTVPPFYSPDTLEWSIQSGTVVLATGNFIYTDTQAVFVDSVCVTNPGDCAILQLGIADNLWGMTYLNFDWMMYGDTISNFMNPNQSYLSENYNFFLHQDCAVSTEEIQESSSFLYPNPAKDCIQWRNTDGAYPGAWRAFSMNGQLVEQGRCDTASINCSQWSNGLYCICFQTKEGWRKELILVNK
jgi:hypothetical protein